MAAVAEKRKSTKPVDGKTPVSGLPASPRVHYAPPCPSCRSQDTKTTSTLTLIRYFKCRRCGWTWSRARHDSEGRITQ